MTTTEFDRTDLDEVLTDIVRDSRAKLLRVPTAKGVVRAMRGEPVGPNPTRSVKRSRNDA